MVELLHSRGVTDLGDCQMLSRVVEESFSRDRPIPIPVDTDTGRYRYRPIPIPADTDKVDADRHRFSSNVSRPVIEILLTLAKHEPFDEFGKKILVCAVITGCSALVNDLLECIPKGETMLAMDDEFLDNYLNGKLAYYERRSFEGGVASIVLLRHHSNQILEGRHSLNIAEGNEQTNHVTDYTRTLEILIKHSIDFVGKNFDARQEVAREDLFIEPFKRPEVRALVRILLQGENDIFSKLIELTYKLKAISFKIFEESTNRRLPTRLGKMLVTFTPTNSTLFRLRRYSGSG